VYQFEDGKMKRIVLGGVILVLMIAVIMLFIIQSDGKPGTPPEGQDSRIYKSLLVSLTDPPDGLMAAKGDGSNETAAIQAIFDYAVEHQQIVFIPPNHTFTVDGLLIAGKRDFTILGYGTLKLRDKAAGPILKLTECHGFQISRLHTDGNIQANAGPDGKFNQDLHSLAITQSYNFKIGSLHDVNPSGDSLYLTDVANGTIDSLEARAEEPSGRNALTITKAQYVTVGSIISDQVGYPKMPGGIALEPNHKDDDIQNILIRQAVIRSGADNGVAITNKTGAVVKDIEINAQIIKHGRSESSAFKLNNVENFKGRIRIEQEGETLCDGASVTGCKNVQAELEIDQAKLGLGIGQNSSGIRLTGKILGTKEAGLALWEGVSDSVIDMEIKQTGLDGTSGRVKIADRLENVIFKGDYSFDGTGDYCFWIDGIVLNSYAENLNTSGWNHQNLVIGSGLNKLAFLRTTAQRTDIAAFQSSSGGEL